MRFGWDLLGTNKYRQNVRFSGAPAPVATRLFTATASSEFHPKRHAPSTQHGVQQNALHTGAISDHTRHNYISSQRLNGLDGPRKERVESLQKQIDFYSGEIHRLKCAQYSQVAVSCLPAELLSDVFLYVIEAGLQNNDTEFAAGTFNFLQACKSWNHMAVNFPRLWVWWIPGAARA